MMYMQRKLDENEARLWEAFCKLVRTPLLPQLPDDFWGRILMATARSASRRFVRCSVPNRLRPRNC
jgi:hypothetical protein